MNHGVEFGQTAYILLTFSSNQILLKLANTLKTLGILNVGAGGGT